ncbi:MAG: phosphatidate cytidylyltransferase [Lachnospiraceae bacterium]|nr:phosphatidate cytidylyltransferase [Lachnospiraceae bacterium]
MFKERLAAGVLLVALMVVTLYFGGFATLAMVELISLLGIYELMRVPKNYSTELLLVTEIFTVVLYALLGTGYTLRAYGFMYVFLMVVFLLVLMCLYVFRYPKYKLQDITLAFFAIFYVGVMLSYIYSIRFLNNGGAYIVLVFLAAWGNDTLAYCVGKLFGKHKMSPKLSPKKSIEGFVGGVVGAALLGVGYSFIFGKVTDTLVDVKLIVAFAVICGLGGAISVVGDLAASAIKRQYEIKDYSNLIPGHGGILDRFDSIIITAPIVYYLITIFVE